MWLILPYLHTLVTATTYELLAILIWCWLRCLACISPRLLTEPRRLTSCVIPIMILVPLHVCSMRFADYVIGLFLEKPVSIVIMATMFFFLIYSTIQITTHNASRKLLPNPVSWPVVHFGCASNVLGRSKGIIQGCFSKPTWLKTILCNF